MFSIAIASDESGVEGGMDRAPGGEGLLESR